MQSGQILNLQPRTAGQSEERTPGLENELTENRQLIEQATFEIRQAQKQLNEQQDEHESHEWHMKVLSALLGFLLVCIAGMIWWAYPTLTAQKKVFADIVSMQTVTDGISQRMNSAEASLKGMAAGLPALSNRVDQLQTTMKTNLQIARNQAQAAATQVGQRIREDVSRSVQAIESRLTAVESNQKEASAHVGQLQDQIAGLKRELAAMREENSAASEKIKELTDAQQTSRSDLSGLTEKVATGQAALHTLSNRIDRKRVDFELQNRRTSQISPGISLTLKRTNTGKQEIDGILQAGADASGLPIRGQGVQKPFLFYPPGETRPAELVLTKVSKNGVSGYVMMPVPEEEAAR